MTIRIKSVARSSLLGLAFLCPSAGVTDGFVPSGQCAVIVASRPSIDDARQVIVQTGSEDIARVFESANGWFAISVGLIGNIGSTAILDDLKRERAIPLDSYCSTGKPYIREVAWREAPVKPLERNEQTISGSTGTAFYVTDTGTALTNAHVVHGCSRLTLAGQPASLVAISTAFDLAAIRLAAPSDTMPLAFAEQEARLNADITIAGYPLHGLLGGLNVGRGSVSSLKGLQGDETNLQISAPVQPGNSGGPVIDRNGGVVGVVVSKLNTAALASVTGDIAQNVNFAVRGSLAKAFLSSNGIEYSISRRSAPIDAETAAELLQSATMLVECD